MRFIQINNFLNFKEIEGDQEIVGYVPTKQGKFKGQGGQKPSSFTSSGAVGVHIATGIDLGKYSPETLQKYGIAGALLDKLRPYLGKTRDKAIMTLAERPLTITRQEAETLDERVHMGYYRQYIRPYVSDFEEMPWQAQAVLFSICYQYGVIGAKRILPLVWQYLRDKNYAGAAYELIYGHMRSQYRLRRRTEGLLLMDYVNSPEDKDANTRRTSKEQLINLYGNIKTAREAAEIDK